MVFLIPLDNRPQTLLNTGLRTVFDRRKPILFMHPYNPPAIPHPDISTGIHA
jgi:hypothetical protein